LAFGQQFSSLIGPVIQIYGSPLVYRTSHLTVLFSPRERSQRYLSSGDAETAHLQTIFWFYATEMQKMRIFMNLLCLSIFPIGVDGWREIPYFLWNKIIIQIVVYHLPPPPPSGSAGRKQQPLSEICLYATRGRQFCRAQWRNGILCNAVGYNVKSIPKWPVRVDGLQQSTYDFVETHY
jgi:hypothetical protein